MVRGGGFASFIGAATSATAVMVNGNTIFTISNGPIIVYMLQSVCVTANDATASTMQYQTNPTVGSAASMSAASATLASATAGTTVTMNPNSFATAPDIVTAANGGIALEGANRMIVQAGTIKVVIGVGSTTGTWKHYIAYSPMAPGVTVV